MNDVVPSEATRDGAPDGAPPERDVLDLARTEEARADKAPDADSGQRRGDAPAGVSDDAAAAKSAEKEDEGEPPPPPPKMVFVVAGLVLLALVAWGGYEHWRAYQDSKQTADDQQSRVVAVRTIEAKKLDAPMALTLPGETDAFDTASIYARATGYISERRVDIGSRVKKGDLLIHIAAPDLDQQLAQAEAQIGQTRAALIQAQSQVGQVQANLDLARVNLARSNQLTQQGYETQRNRDTDQANQETQQANLEAAKAGVKVADANIQAQQATIDRLKALTAFEDVRAPFDGIVTARNVDKGDLVNADSPTATPMLTVARDDVLRVMVRVPQNAAVGVHDGLEASVTVPQMPNRVFKGQIARSSVALLYSSRTLTTEVDIPNQDGVLRSGLYVSVTLQVPRAPPEVNVPAESLIFNQHGMQVASVEQDKVKLHQIDIDRDHGTSVDLRQGLEGGERIVINPPAVLADGQQVKESRTEDEKKPDDQQGGQAKPDQKPGEGPKPGDDQKAENSQKPADSQKADAGKSAQD